MSEHTPRLTTNFNDDRYHMEAISLSDFREYMKHEDAKEQRNKQIGRISLGVPNWNQEPLLARPEQSIEPEQFRLEGEAAHGVLGEMSRPEFATGDLFVPENEWLERVGESESLGVLKRGDEGEPFAIPANQIISIPGAASWRDKVNKNLRHVSRLVKRETPAPVTGMAIAYRQPDGKVFFRLVNNGAHAAMAARRKRGGIVYLNGDISVKSVDHNIVPDQAAY